MGRLQGGCDVPARRRRGRSWRSARWVHLVTVAAALVACSGAPVPTSTPAATASAGTTATASPTAVPSKVPPDQPSAVSDRCGGPQGPRAVDLAIPAAAGSVITGFDVGASSTVAVLLHQSRADSCGWWSYASWLATTAGVRAVAVDFCGDGRSHCSTALAQNPRDQIRTVVRWARQHGGRRVVLVGASMGGAEAVAAAPTVGVDAVVDLSGPPDWPGALFREAAPLLKVPTLVVISRTTDTPDFEKLRQDFALVASPRKRFVDAPGGHGWGMLEAISAGTPALTPLAQTVADWISPRG